MFGGLEIFNIHPKTYFEFLGSVYSAFMRIRDLFDLGPPLFATRRFTKFLLGSS